MKPENLIDTLKHQHGEILKRLKTVMNINTPADERFRLLKKIQLILMKHLELEDKMLYPVLKKKAKKDPKLARTLKIFADDMEEISTFALIFFKKLDKPDENTFLFARKIGNLTGELQKRIRREENVLYPEYAKL